MTNKDTLSPDQQKRLAISQAKLHFSITQCEKTLKQTDSWLTRNARQGIEALSPAETFWLSQKDWEPTEKTFILYHVNNERNKRKNTNISLFDIGTTAGLALMAAATHLNGQHHLSAMLSVLTVARALDMAIDYTKERTVNKLTQNTLQDVSKTNDHIKTGIRCLTQRSTGTR